MMGRFTEQRSRRIKFKKKLKGKLGPLNVYDIKNIVKSDIRKNLHLQNKF